MEQSPQLDKKFLALFWNRKVNYRLHKLALVVCFISQMNLIHNFPSCSFNIHLFISLPNTRHLQNSLFATDFHTEIVYAFLLSSYLLRALSVSSCRNNTCIWRHLNKSKF